MSAASVPSAVLDALPAEIATVDADGTVVAANSAWRRFRCAGAPPTRGSVIGLAVGENVLAAGSAGAAAGDESAHVLGQLVRATLAGRGDRSEYVYPRRCGDRQRWSAVRVLPLLPVLAAPDEPDVPHVPDEPDEPDEPDVPEPPRAAPPGGAVLVHEDVTTRKELELDLRRRATHDALTGLPNRVLLEDRLRHAIAPALRRDAGRQVAVLFLDLDDFRTVNERFGHLGGDEALRQVAARLSAVLRPQDTLARWGGDEFVVLAENIGGSDAVHLVERLSRALREPLLLDGGRRLRLSVSIGLALSGANLARDLPAGPSPAGWVVAPVPPAGRGEALVQLADEALGRAKARAHSHAARHLADDRRRPEPEPPTDADPHG